MRHSHVYQTETQCTWHSHRGAHVSGLFPHERGALHLWVGGRSRRRDRAPRDTATGSCRRASTTRGAPLPTGHFFLVECGSDRLCTGRRWPLWRRQPRVGRLGFSSLGMLVLMIFFYDLGWLCNFECALHCLELNVRASLPVYINMTSSVRLDVARSQLGRSRCTRVQCAWYYRWNFLSI